MKSNHAQPAYNGIKDVLRSVYKEGGVRGLYRGVGMYVLHCCVHYLSMWSAIYMAFMSFNRFFFFFLGWRVGILFFIL